MLGWTMVIGGLLVASATASTPQRLDSDAVLRSSPSVGITALAPNALLDSRGVAVHACGSEEGVDASGTIRWQGGDARHVYVIDPERALPDGVLDLALPAGTLWRLDTELLGSPFRSGLSFGTVPTGSRQVWPLTGAPSLTPGHRYLLFVLAAVGQPLASCTFEAR